MTTPAAPCISATMASSHTRTGGGASTHADEQRHLRHGEQRLRDHRFAGERVHREDGVRVVLRIMTASVV